MRHQVLMQFFVRGDNEWLVNFLKENLANAVCRCKLFRSSDVLIELAERGGDISSFADRQGIEFGIDSGRGSVWLQLTDQQYTIRTRERSQN